MVSARSCASSSNGVGPGVNSLSLMIPGISVFTVHSFRLGKKYLGNTQSEFGQFNFNGTSAFASLNAGGNTGYGMAAKWSTYLGHLSRTVCCLTRIAR